MDTQNVLQDKKAIIYVRVSTDEQVDNYSLDTQEDLCSKEAERRGYEVIDVFREEGKSAKTIIGRPTIIKMLAYCLKNRNKVDGLFVYRLDRVAREVGDYISIRKKLFEYGIKLISTREPTGDSPSETFMEQVFAAAAQYDNAVRGERSKSGMYARFQAGLPNAVPLGYLMKDGFAVKDASTFDMVKIAWDLMATGTKTVPEIAKNLELQGFKILGRKPRTKDFYRTFKHKFYCGVLTSVTYKEEVIAQHDPMITLNQFNKVQQILDKRYKRATKILKHGADNPDFPFKKHIRCSKCLHFMSGAWTQGRSKKYPYYMCGVRCTSLSINGNILHKILFNLIKITPVSNQNKKPLIQYFHNRSEQQRKGINHRIAKINEKISDFKEKRTLVVRKNVEGTYSDEITKEQIDLIAKQITSLEIESKKIQLYSSNIQKLREHFKDILDNFYETFQKASIIQRRTLLHFLFPVGLIWDYERVLRINTSKVDKALVDQRNKEAFETLVDMLENDVNYN